MKTPTRDSSLHRMLLQQLESLHRSGVTQLRRTAETAGAQISTSRPATIATPVPVAMPVTDTAAKARPASVPVPTQATPVQEAPMIKRKSNDTTDKRLEAIRKEVMACQRCSELACSRTQTVFGVGNTKPRLCFFGEAPGADEDRTGEPFVGRAGQLLTDIIVKGMRLSRSDVYILNVLKCRPPGNRVPSDDEMANCREFFERQFEVLKPEFICCLGSTAARALFGPIQSLGSMRRKWFEYRGSKVIVTYHPSYLLRNPAAKKDVWEDIQMLMREMGLPIEPK